MNVPLPEVIMLNKECSAHSGYDNHPIATVVPHLRLSVGTESE
jgi:hypothetical protein